MPIIDTMIEAETVPIIDTMIEKAIVGDTINNYNITLFGNHSQFLPTQPCTIQIGGTTISIRPSKSNESPRGIKRKLDDNDHDRPPPKRQKMEPSNGQYDDREMHSDGAPMDTLVLNSERLAVMFLGPRSAESPDPDSMFSSSSEKREMEDDDDENEDDDLKYAEESIAEQMAGSNRDFSFVNRSEEPATD